MTARPSRPHRPWPPRRGRQHFPAAVLGLLLLACPASLAQDQVAPGRELPGIAPRTERLAKLEGLLDLYLDAREGRIFLALPASVSAGEGLELLYGEGIRVGLGSNPVGLDRARLGPTRHVRFRRIGGRVLLEQLNTRYRALSGDPAERRAVRESFATSVLWAGAIEAEDPGGSLLVDLTPLLTSDIFGFAATLDEAGQGSFALDPARSAVDLQEVHVFPDNIEIDALLTFAGAKPGEHVRETAPDPRSVTMIQHHSFVKLPDPGYRPRRFDPRAGSFDVSFLDYAAPLHNPLETKWIVRHRLEKTDPASPRSSVKEPIVYYLDRGVPEPVRSALLEGAAWWATAFEEAGFIDAYRVEMLPEGAHPLDARYNVINWVHRSTRGWSYGGGMIDPRTGEMIKGHVLLGSLRVRHDRLLFEGLAGTERSGSGAPNDSVQIALARLRQLSAHEVGHTLGFDHNFAASTYGRASVMDYPAPLIDIRPDGSLDFSRAYAEGVGAWDVHAVRYAYGQPARPEDEEAFLEEVVSDGIRKGYVYLSDHDARPGGAAHPLGSLWDNGEDSVAELRRTLRVRRAGIDGFGEDRVAAGVPLALLQEVFTPVYFHHRYQLDAAAKLLGGIDYRYAVRGDGQRAVAMIDPRRQQEALEAILGILDPKELDIPEKVLALLAPRPVGYPATMELPKGSSDPAFDPLGAARTAAAMAIGSILQPERAARLVDFHRRDPVQPGFDGILDALVERTFGARRPEAEGPRLEILAGIVRTAAVEGLIALSAHERVTAEVRAAADRALTDLAARLGPSSVPLDAMLAGRIRRYLDRATPSLPGEPAAAPAPPGSPIGAPPGLAGCSQEDPWT